MWDALTFFYTSAIIVLAAIFLFVAVGDLEPNPRLAALLKAAIIAAAAAQSPITYCPAACSQPSDEYGLSLGNVCVETGLGQTF